MSHLDKGFYAASCNLPRRTKRLRPDSDEPDSAPPPQVQKRNATSSSPVLTLQPRPILPKRATTSVKSGGAHAPSASPLVQPVIPNEGPTSSNPISTNSPGKRGRKPGPLSRSAREAQRRLNHSIIEKARRTKINNALATLKELVPLDYGMKPKGQEGKSDEESDSDDEVDDADGEYGNGKKQSKHKPTGRKEEKEREYKLEILVRTVAFMQDLLERVKVLEQTSTLCPSCGGGPDAACTQLETTSFDRSGPFPGASVQEVTHPADLSRRPTSGHEPREPIREALPPTSYQEPSQQSPLAKHSLPSISSWLPKTLLDPSIFSVSSHTRLERAHNTIDSILPLQLPTPPSSTHFHPAATVAGPTSTASSTSTMGDSRQQMHSPILTRTPEEEHAASMLLQIRGGGPGSSPTFHPLPPSIMSSTSGPLVPIPPPLTASTMGRTGHKEEPYNRISVQTPATLLGLLTPPNS